LGNVACDETFNADFFWLLPLLEDCLACTSCRERIVDESNALPTAADLILVASPQATALLGDVSFVVLDRSSLGSLSKAIVARGNGTGMFNAPSTAVSACCSVPKVSQALDIGDLSTFDGSSFPSNVVLAWSVC
jgi:hypothetical protein